MTKIKVKKVVTALLLMIIPIGIIITAFALRHNAGPFWLGFNYDPDYAYLMNALNLVEGKDIGHYDHPGTPVQMFGALSIRIIYRLNPNHQSTIAADVIKNPELYLWTINTIIVIITAGLAAYIGWLLYTLTGSVWLSLIGQSVPFFDPSILANSLTKVAPEALLLPEVMLIIILLLHLYKKRAAINAIVTPILFGIIVGLGLATKLTFLPIILLPLPLFNKGRFFVLYVVSLVGSFYIFTLPIVSHYGEFFGWVKRLSTNAGRHGDAGSQLVRLEAFKNNLLRINDTFPYLGFLILLAIGVIVVGLWSRKRAKDFAYFELRILLAIVLVEVMSIAMVVVKDALPSHYLLPSLSLLAALVVSLVLFVRSAPLQPIAKHLLFSLVGAITLAVYVSTYRGIINVYKVAGLQKIQLTRVYEMVQSQYQDYAKVRYFRSSDPSFALEFGNRFALSAHQKMIDHIYPNDYYYDLAKNQYYKYGRAYEISELLSSYDGKVILVGTSFDRQYADTPSYKPKEPIIDVVGGTIETIYRFNQ